MILSCVTTTPGERVKVTPLALQALRSQLLFCFLRLCCTSHALVTSERLNEALDWSISGADPQRWAEAASEVRGGRSVSPFFIFPTTFSL